MCPQTANDFFKIKRNQSEIKSEIINEYFKAWASILLLGQNYKELNRLYYIDLFAGKGIYDNNDPSTPIKVLTSIINNKVFNRKVQTFFNDLEVAEDLDNNLKNLPFYKELINKPIVLNKEANRNLLNSLINPNTPSLTFIDPFGYKGISIDLCISALKDWGSDLFMLFNFNRIQMAMSNPKVQHLMKEIFGYKYDTLKSQLNQLRGFEKEKYIISEFSNIFNKKGYYSISFKIEFEKRNQTSHYLFFVSKARIAYTKMKDILSKYSNYSTDGIPLFTVNNNYVPTLFPDYSIQILKDNILELKSEFNNKTINFIFDHHNIGTNYIKRNYKNALIELINENKVEAYNTRDKKTECPSFNSRIEFI